MHTSLLFPEMAPPPSFDFPEPLSDKYRPRRIADFAGLGDKPGKNGEMVPGPKSILAGFAANPRSRGLLFIGPAGMGKTSMAFALASEIQGFVYHIKSRKCTIEEVERKAFSAWYVPPIGYKWNVIIVDEVDLASLAAQELMLSYLDGTNTIPNTVWVFTGNSTERLERRFLSRNLVLNFTNYRIQAEAAELLESVWTREASPNLPRPNFARIIKEATGNIREALASLETRLDAARA
jgi:replication-associated recombination protein RarA